MRVNRGDVIAGMHALDIRSFFRRKTGFGVSYPTLMRTFSITKRRAEKLTQDLSEMELVRRAEFQPDKNSTRYEITDAGNRLGIAKAGKPVLRATAERILREFTH